MDELKMDCFFMEDVLVPHTADRISGANFFIQKRFGNI